MGLTINLHKYVGLIVKPQGKGQKLVDGEKTAQKFAKRMYEGKSEKSEVFLVYLTKSTFTPTKMRFKIPDGGTQGDPKTRM